MNAQTGPSLPTYADVEAAAERLKGIAHHTPAMSSATANRRTGASLVFKPENLQRMGAFKFRGGYNAIASLSPAQKKAGVVTFSSGNHAQAIAYAGQLLGVPTTIIMPNDAPAAKVAATEGYGGQIVRYDRYTEDRLVIGDRLAAEVFQMIAEGLSNVRRHTLAGRAVVRLARENGTVTVEIENEGRVGQAQSHFIPRSIAERAEALGARRTGFSRVGEDGNGFVVLQDPEGNEFCFVVDRDGGWDGVLRQAIEAGTPAA